MHEFTDPELHRIREMLSQQYGEDVEIQLADCDLLLDGKDAGPTTCPTIFWYQRGANFVVYKVDTGQFRSQFFYTPHEQFGTGIEEYNNLEECVAALMQTQADHERDSEGLQSGSAGRKPGAGD